MSARPLIETPVPPADIKRGDGDSLCTFTQSFCRHTKDGIAARAGELIQLRPFQRELFSKVRARRPDGRLRHREALIGLPRKNSKSELGSSLALYGLLDGMGEGLEVYSCASDKDQAKIVFGVAKKMVERDPNLDGGTSTNRKDGLVVCYRDVLEVPSTGSIYKALSSEAFSKEGLNPSMVVYDELHAAPTDELYYVMSLGSGARYDPLLVAITTAGVKYDSTGQDSICYRRYQYGCQVASGEVEDDSFYFVWYGAPKGADYRDEAVWAAANPGYGDFLDPDDFRHALGSVSENEFRTKRLNQWVSSVQAWLPMGAWGACRYGGEFVPGARGVVLGFDGSKNGDCTALVAVTVESEPQIKVLGLWEKPEDAPEGWRVPRAEVREAIRRACREFHVAEIAADDWFWQDALEELESEGLPVVGFPQNLSRMGPATQRFYEMVTTRKLRHDGDPRLARHLDNAQLRTESRGSRLQKDAKNSRRHIDLAVAAVMAVDRAAYWLTQGGPGTWTDYQGKTHRVEDLKFVW